MSLDNFCAPGEGGLKTFPFVDTENNSKNSSVKGWRYQQRYTYRLKMGVVAEG